MLDSICEVRIQSHWQTHLTVVATLTNLIVLTKNVTKLKLYYQMLLLLL